MTYVLERPPLKASETTTYFRVLGGDLFDWVPDRDAATSWANFWDAYQVSRLQYIRSGIIAVVSGPDDRTIGYVDPDEMLVARRYDTWAQDTKRMETLRQDGWVGQFCGHLVINGVFYGESYVFQKRRARS